MNSGQDGGTGKHASPPRTNIAKNTAMLQKKNITKNCQKIELCGSLTTKDLNKPHSPRRVGGCRDLETCGDIEGHKEAWR